MLSGAPPPQWAWQFAVVQARNWDDAENDVSLESMLGLSREGHASSRRIARHSGTVYFVAWRIEKTRPSWKKTVGAEVFWSEVARVAAAEYRMPPVGWEKARKMYREYAKKMG